MIIGCACLPPYPHCKQDSGFWDDLSALYTTLITNYGYKKENIFVHYFRGPFTPSNNYHNDLNGDGFFDDIDSSAYKETIHNTFKSLSVGGTHELHEDDQLFVFVSDHGGWDLTNSFICLPYKNDTVDYDILKSTTFTEYLQDIKCGQMIFLMQQCNSGGFKSKLLDYNHYPPLCKNRTIQTASDSNGEAHSESWITKRKFWEFTYYWTAAVRGYFPYIDPVYGPSHGFRVIMYSRFPMIPASMTLVWLHIL